MQTITKAQYQRLMALQQKHITVMEELYKIIGIQNQILLNNSKQAKQLSQQQLALRQELAAIKQAMGQKPVRKKTARTKP